MSHEKLVDEAADVAAVLATTADILYEIAATPQQDTAVLRGEFLEAVERLQARLEVTCALLVGRD